MSEIKSIELRQKEVNGFDVIEHHGCTLSQAQEVVSKANAEAVGGYSDWVLPDLVTSQALRLVSGGGGFYAWGSSPYVGNINYAWHVCFRDGRVESGVRSEVRLVRASQCLALGQAAHLKSIEEGRMNMEALHKPKERMFLLEEMCRTSLAKPRPKAQLALERMFLKEVSGLDIIYHGKCNFSDAADLVAIANAGEIGGHTDWVLPDLVTAQALRLISGGGGISAWSSSPEVTSGAWCVSFNDGDVLARCRDHLSHVRLVRVAQRLALGEAGHRISLAQAGIVLDAEELQPLADRPRGG